MNEVYFMVTVVKRESIEDYITFFRCHEVTAVFAGFGKGTAQKKTLDYLGIEKTEKGILYMLLHGKQVRRIIEDLIDEMGIDLPDNGVALTIPVSSIAESTEIRYLKQEADVKICGGNEMDDMQNVLIVIIAEKGNTDLVMDAARSANASGGTVQHVKGTGGHLANKFFGVSIGDEKEMIYIVAKRKDKAGIMKAVHEKTHAAIFTLPVEDVVGFRRLKNMKECEE